MGWYVSPRTLRAPKSPADYIAPACRARAGALLRHASWVVPLTSGSQTCESGRPPSSLPWRVGCRCRCRCPSRSRYCCRCCCYCHCCCCWSVAASWTWICCSSCPSCAAEATGGVQGDGRRARRGRGRSNMVLAGTNCWGGPARRPPLRPPRWLAAGGPAALRRPITFFFFSFLSFLRLSFLCSARARGSRGAERCCTAASGGVGPPPLAQCSAAQRSRASLPWQVTHSSSSSPRLPRPLLRPYGRHGLHLVGPCTPLQRGRA